MSAEQVRPGYQLTEVGVIPEDWKVKPLGKIGIFSKGQGIKRDDVLDEGLPCIRYGEIYTTYDHYVYEPLTRISADTAKRSRPIQFGDILFTGSGETADEIGKCVAYLGNDIAYAGGDIIILTPTGCDPMFLGYMLNFSTVSQQKSNLGQGDIIVHIATRNLAKVLVPLPPLAEQRAIAAALGDVDALLAGLERLIAKRRAVKQAAMDALLSGRVRLPGFGQGAGRRQSEVGVIPEDWEVKKIGDVLQLQYGKSQKGITTDDGLYPTLATSGQVGRTNSFLYDKPSIIIGRKGTIDAPQYVECPFWPIDTTFYCVLSENIFPKFLYYLLSTVPWQSYNEASGVPSLNADTVHAIKIALPSLPEQRAIAAVLSDMDAAIAALERQRDKVQALKQGMMAELLTGRVRLVESPPARYNDDRSTGEEKRL